MTQEEKDAQFLDDAIIRLMRIHEEKPDIFFSMVKIELLQAMRHGAESVGEVKKPQDDTTGDPTDDYHEHLDECEQCREHPFNQCPTGNELLRKAGTYAMKKLGQHCPPADTPSPTWPDEDPNAK